MTVDGWRVKTFRMSWRRISLGAFNESIESAFSGGTASISRQKVSMNALQCSTIMHMVHHVELFVSTEVAALASRRSSGMFPHYPRLTFFFP